jgi:hypothetical protein
MIAEHEAQHGPLPGSVKEWYLVPKVVPLQNDDGEIGWPFGVETLWQQFSNFDKPGPLADVLDGIANPEDEVAQRYTKFLAENQGVVRWWFEHDGSDDPPVWVDNDDPGIPAHWTLDSRFSDFVFGWFATFGFDTDWRLIHEPDVPALLNLTPERAIIHANGLWLRTPDEPFHPPVIDFLIDQFGEPHVTPRAGNVSTYTWRPNGGTIRVTADEPTLVGGLSAWWVHAESPERLAEFAKLLLPWGTLRETLRADTEAARDVLNRVRGS